MHLPDRHHRTLGTQIINQCYSFGRYCNLFTRELTGVGDINFVNNRTANVGRVDTQGIDLGLGQKYRLPETAWGNFRFSLDATCVVEVQHAEGPGRRFDAVQQRRFVRPASSQGGDGYYARWRGYAGVAWNLGAFDASWRARYIGPTRFGAQAVAGDGYSGREPERCSLAGLPHRRRDVSQPAVRLQLEPLHTNLEIGVDNVFDKQPPQLFQYGFDSNTDASYVRHRGSLLLGSRRREVLKTSA